MDEVLFKLDLVRGVDDLLNVGFTSVVATNCELVKFVDQEKRRVFSPGSRLLKINGAISLCILANLLPDLAYLYNAIAIFDPKLGFYVVCRSDIPDFKVGDLLK